MKILSFELLAAMYPPNIYPLFHQAVPAVPIGRAAALQGFAMNHSCHCFELKRSNPEEHQSLKPLFKAQSSGKSTAPRHQHHTNSALQCRETLKSMKRSRAGRRLSCGSLHSPHLHRIIYLHIGFTSRRHGAGVEVLMVTWRLGAITASSATMAYPAVRSSIPARDCI